MTRRSWLRQTAQGLAAAAIPAASRAQAQQRPINIVYILSDDHRYDFFGAMGHPWLKGKTPNMDRMATEGLHFRNSFVVTSLCSPSRASILTGQHMFRHRVINNSTDLPAGLPTFPQILQQHGYRTGFIGKWHMGSDSDAPRPGFDHWLSFKGQGAYFDAPVNRNGKSEKASGYMADVLTDEAVAFLRANRDRPFCLYLSHKNVHDPFEPAPRHKGTFATNPIPYPATYPNLPENRDGKPDWILRQRNSWHGADGALAKPGGFEAMYRGYCEALLSVDDSIGRVRQELESLGIRENTLLIYHSDNGYLHGEHGLIDKRVMYEPSLRVPLLMECPSLIRRQRDVQEMALTLDIGPTLLDVAGAPIPAGMQGHSLLPLIRGESVQWRDQFVYVYFWEREAPHTPVIWGLRTPRYSLIHSYGIWDIPELYDLEKDPGQTNNLLAGVRTYGMKYGRVERYIEDPALRSLYLDLLGRLQNEMRRLGARLDPEWGA